MLTGLFNAQRVAVVGVSEDPENISRIVARNLVRLGFAGEVFLVGRSGGTLDGRTILPSVADIPGSIELAILAVPQHVILHTLDQCGQKGGRWAVVLTSGFSEYDDGRLKIEDEIRAVLRRHGMRLVGPNGLGIINTANALASPFAPLEKKDLLPGPVSIICQSGGVATSFTSQLCLRGPGLSKFVSLGNKLDLDEVDYLSYLAEDPSTEVIAMFLEGFRRGGVFVSTAQRCRKPMMLLKGNATETGAKVARSHTAALASDDRVVNAALRKAGVVRVKDLRSMSIASGVLRLPRLAGNRLVVCCGSGGYSVILADRLEERGFQFAKIDQGLLSEIESLGRAQVVRLTNPIDFGNIYDTPLIVDLVRRIAKLPEVDGIVLVYHLGSGSNFTVESSEDDRFRATCSFVRAIRDISFQVGKPVIVSSLGARDRMTEISRATDFPIVVDPEDIVEATALLREHAALTDGRRPSMGSAVASGVDRARAAELLGRAANQRELGAECMPALEAYGLPMVVPELAQEESVARRIIQALGVPAAMKVRSLDVLHKSDAGGVRLNVVGPEAAGSAFREIVAAVRQYAPHARIQGIDVQPMVVGGWEVIVGARRDPQFGPAVMFGLGGIYAEALNEVAVRLAPVDRDEAHEMIAELRAGRLLSGLRGQAPSDVAALAEVIVRLSQFITDLPDVEEVDLNPVRVLDAGKGCQVVDARLILRARDGVPA